ncbi:hypothetical protein GC174_08515 [bacterium]|nr:hypothetical protein [bacterium]
MQITPALIRLILSAQILIVFNAGMALAVDETKETTTAEKTKDSKTETKKADSSSGNSPQGKKKKPDYKSFLSRAAKIRFAKAERIAQKLYPGKTKEIELERDDDKLLYSVEIEGADGTKEISIDASTGKVLKVEKESEEG